MNMRLVDRSTLCPFCGTSPCPDACPVNEWPRRVDARLLFTRILLGLGLLLALTAMCAPKFGLSLGLSLSGLACCLVYATLRVAEKPGESEGRVTGRRNR